MTKHFTDGIVFIYSNDGDLIAKTTVTGHNRDEMYIEVMDGLKDVKPGTRLQLLIVHPSGASEFSATYRTVRQGIYEISIYDERERYVRASVRKQLNASAVISDMDTSGIDKKPLSEPLPVRIENMSTTGILIVSEDTQLDIGALLQIEINVQSPRPGTTGKTGILYGEIVREEIHGDLYKYGCKLFFFD
jgi:hypothetical protein